MRHGLQQAENSPQAILVLKSHDGIHVFLTSLCSFMLVSCPPRRWAKPARLPDMAMVRQDLCLKHELCLSPLPLMPPQLT